MAFDQLHPDDQATAQRLSQMYTALDYMINDDCADRSQADMNAIHRVQAIVLEDLQRLYAEAV